MVRPWGGWKIDVWGVGWDGVGKYRVKSNFRVHLDVYSSSHEVKFFAKIMEAETSQVRLTFSFLI